MEGQATFAQVFGIREIDAPAPDRDTLVHVATVQGWSAACCFPAIGVVMALRG